MRMRGNSVHVSPRPGEEGEGEKEKKKKEGRAGHVDSLCEESLTASFRNYRAEWISNPSTSAEERRHRRGRRRRARPPSPDQNMLNVTPRITSRVQLDPQSVATVIPPELNEPRVSHCTRRIPHRFILSGPPVERDNLFECSTTSCSSSRSRVFL